MGFMPPFVAEDGGATHFLARHGCFFFPRREENDSIYTVLATGPTTCFTVQEQVPQKIDYLGYVKPAHLGKDSGWSHGPYALHSIFSPSPVTLLERVDLPNHGFPVQPKFSIRFLSHFCLVLPPPLRFSATNG
jgi:hypothetical protein